MSSIAQLVESIAWRGAAMRAKVTKAFKSRKDAQVFLVGDVIDVDKQRLDALLAAGFVDVEKDEKKDKNNKGE